ncbi:MAG: hypothetical protein CBARDMAM_6663 [uncultured Caballeronia sp.]|nr:MAG: hypothetical protein CBARDMAM_6663 [uncultured Caballeronia sp.]
MNRRPAKSCSITSDRNSTEIADLQESRTMEKTCTAMLVIAYLTSACSSTGVVPMDGIRT